MSRLVARYQSLKCRTVVLSSFFVSGVGGGSSRGGISDNKTTSKRARKPVRIRA